MSLPPATATPARVLARRAVRLLTRLADAYRAAGDVEGVAETETLRDVIGRRLSRSRSHVNTFSISAHNSGRHS
jgi:hypothetical protein